MAPRRNQKKQWLCSSKACKTNYEKNSEKPVMAFTPKLNKNLLKIKVEKHTVDCLLDSGGEISAISHHVLKQVAPTAQLNHLIYQLL